MWYEVEVSSTITIAVEADSEEQATEVAMSLFTEEFRLEVDSCTEIDESQKDNCDIVAE